jgi:hypothetical protein
VKNYIIKFNKKNLVDDDVFLSNCLSKKSIGVEIPVIEYNKQRSFIGKALLNQDREGIFIEKLELKDHDDILSFCDQASIGFINRKSYYQLSDNKLIQNYSKIEIMEIIPAFGLMFTRKSEITAFCEKEIENFKKNKETIKLKQELRDCKDSLIGLSDD